MHTRQKFMTIDPAGKKGMKALDVFDHMVVFSKKAWIGPGETDPTGAGIPEAAYEAKRTPGGSYEGGASSRIEAENSARRAENSENVSVFQNSVLFSHGEGRARRASAGKKVKYTDAGSE